MSSFTVTINLLFGLPVVLPSRSNLCILLLIYLRIYFVKTCPNYLSLAHWLQYFNLCFPRLHPVFSSVLQSSICAMFSFKGFFLTFDFQHTLLVLSKMLPSQIIKEPHGIILPNCSPKHFYYSLTGRFPFDMTKAGCNSCELAPKATEDDKRSNSGSECGPHCHRSTRRSGTAWHFFAFQEEQRMEAMWYQLSPDWSLTIIGIFLWGCHRKSQLVVM